MNIPSILFILMMFHREEALKTMSSLVYQVYRKNKRIEVLQETEVKKYEIKEKTE